jgi:ornithine cyclodeaminase/alanine dehydrogenase-like protein (mu-crystallin family)
MANVYTLDRIRSVVDGLDLGPVIEAGFVAYTRGRVVVPPVGELIFEKPPGDTHIKYGYIQGDPSFVIKVASGFYDNPSLGLPSSSGLMLVFSQTTGMLDSILLDEGFLTDLRTALAGRIAAAYLAPARVDGIGVVGTGIQARMQVEHLKGVTPCRKVVAWGRDPGRLERYKHDMEGAGFQVRTTREIRAVGEACNLIVTATPASEPLLTADHIRPGTHITAMGSDTADKQELDVGILERADRVVADSRAQCRQRGEIHKALAAGAVSMDQVVELGQVIAGDVPGRTSDDQVTIADLTGVAVQDVQIATAVVQALSEEKGAWP